MYEARSFVYVILCTVVVWGVASCASSTCANKRGAGDAVDTVATNQRAAGAVEDAVRHLEDTISSSRSRLADIQTTSGAIADAVDRLEYLFGCYESEVDQLLREIDALRGELEAARQDNSDSGGGVGSGYIGEGGNPIF